MGRGRKSCARDDCVTLPSFGVEGTSQRVFCAQHSKQGMVNLDRKKCARGDCPTLPSFGVEGSKQRVFCAQHAERGMINLDRKKCAGVGCAKVPSFGVVGSRKREFCAQHAHQGMIYIGRCAFTGCHEQTSHGKEGRRLELCHMHAQLGEFDIAAPSEITGPVTQQCFNSAAACPFDFYSPPRKNAYHHVAPNSPPSSKAPPNNIAVAAAPATVVAPTAATSSTKVCNEDGCTKVPSYGTAGGNKRHFCRQHARAGMVNVASKKCAHAGCGKVATYGTLGGKRELCALHAGQGMVDVTNRMCTSRNCYLRATFGMEGSGKRERCADHAEKGMVSLNRRRCGRADCSKAPVFSGKGEKKEMFCADHDERQQKRQQRQERQQRHERHQRNAVLGVKGGGIIIANSKKRPDNGVGASPTETEENEPDRTGAGRHAKHAKSALLDHHPAGKTGADNHQQQLHGRGTDEGVEETRPNEEFRFWHTEPRDINSAATNAKIAGLPAVATSSAAATAADSGKPGQVAGSIPGAVVEDASNSTKKHDINPSDARRALRYAAYSKKADQDVPVPTKRKIPKTASTRSLDYEKRTPFAIPLTLWHGKACTRADLLLQTESGWSRWNWQSALNSTPNGHSR